MKAIVLAGTGGPEALRVADRPDPVTGTEEVVVRIRATAVNRAELLQRRGLYPAPPGSPKDIPGLEFAGEVAACGPRVSDLRPGDRVMGILGGGGHSEAVAVHERLCLAHDALIVQGGMGPGEAVLVHAAASGVGTAAGQLAAACGARPLALSRTAAKQDRLASLGAARVIDPGAPRAHALLEANATSGKVVLRV